MLNVVQVFKIPFAFNHSRFLVEMSGEMLCQGQGFQSYTYLAQIPGSGHGIFGQNCNEVYTNNFCDICSYVLPCIAEFKRFSAMRCTTNSKVILICSYFRTFYFIVLNACKYFRNLT